MAPRADDHAPPLWAHDDPAARLAELLTTDAELKVAPLRRDVRLLGTLPAIGGGVWHRDIEIRAVSAYPKNVAGAYRRARRDFHRGVRGNCAVFDVTVPDPLYFCGD